MIGNYVKSKCNFQMIKKITNQKRTFIKKKALKKRIN